MAGGVLGCAAEYLVEVVEEIVAMNPATGQASYGATVGEISDFTELVWDRRLDDTSAAVITIPNNETCCSDLIAGLHVVHYGIVIYRDGERVWDGPITRLEYGRDQIVITAQDISWLLKKRLLGRDLCFSSDDAVCTGGDGGLRFGVQAPEFVGAKLVEEGFRIDGHGAIVTLLCQGTAQFEASYVQYGGPVYDLLQKLASEFLNWTVLGRRFVISCGGLTDGTGLARTETLSCEDFVNDVFTVTEDGDSLLTQDVQFADSAIINGVESTAIGVSQSFNIGTQADSYYGLLQAIQDGNEALAVSGTTDPAIVLTAAAKNVLTSSYPPPVALSADGLQLSPDAPVEISELVPGVIVPLFADCICRPTNELYMLSKLEVSVTSDGESVTPSLIRLGQDNQGTFEEDRSF